MTMLNHRSWGWAGVLIGGVASVTAPVACTGGFSSEDCKATRTCPPAAAGQGGESTDPPVGEEGGVGGAAAAGAPPVVVGGEPSEGGVGGCSGADCEPIADPPFVVRVSPAAGAVDVEPLGNVVVEFSEELDESTVTAATFRVLDGDAELDGELVLEKNKVTFTPSRSLRLDAEYTVSIATGVADVEGEPLAAPFDSKFQVRVGVWKMSDVVDDNVAILADTLPMTAAGNVLVGWSYTAGGLYCTALTRWFARGVALDDVTRLDDRSSSCSTGILTAADGDGNAVVAWQSQVPKSGLAVRRFDGSAWEQSSSLLSTTSAPTRVATSGAGDAQVFAGAGLWRASAEQAWPVAPHTLTADPMYYRPSVGFDEDGNGIAIWKSRVSAEVIRVSTYSPVAGAWSSSVPLPGSTLNTSDFEIGQPVLSVAPNGEAVAVWRVGPLFSVSELLGSYFDGEAWSEPKVISGEQHGFAHEQALSVAYDAGSFVVAWEMGDATKALYTLEFAPAVGWGKPELQVVAGTAVPGSLRLMADGRGTRLLVWAVAGSSSMALWGRPFVRGAWGTAAPIPGADITGTTLQELPVAMNASGMAAIAWVNRGTDSLAADVRLASLY